MLAEIALTSHTLAVHLVHSVGALTASGPAIAPNAGTSAGTSFFGTEIGRILKALLQALGVLVLLFTLVKSAKEFISGKVGPGVKILFSGLLFATLCITPEILTGFVNVVGDILTKVSSSFDTITKGK